jgi:hypothetical protein
MINTKSSGAKVPHGSSLPSFAPVWGMRPAPAGMRFKRQCFCTVQLGCGEGFASLRASRRENTLVDYSDKQLPNARHVAEVFEIEPAYHADMRSQPLGTTLPRGRRDAAGTGPRDLPGRRSPVLSKRASRKGISRWLSSGSSWAPILVERLQQLHCEPASAAGFARAGRHLRRSRGGASETPGYHGAKRKPARCPREPLVVSSLAHPQRPAWAQCLQRGKAPTRFFRNSSSAGSETGGVLSARLA